MLEKFPQKGHQEVVHLEIHQGDLLEDDQGVLQEDLPRGHKEVHKESPPEEPKVAIRVKRMKGKKRRPRQTECTRETATKVQIYLVTLSELARFR